MKKAKANIDWQGHRGARGDFPENTIPGFIYALDCGMTTLEMDVVISADKQVVVSHEPFFNTEICHFEFTYEAGGSSANNMYRFSYDEISKIDCGSKENPNFPNQKKMTVSKPLLKEVIAEAEKHAVKTGRDSPFYNIEIKSTPEWEKHYHPVIEEYSDLLLAACKQGGIMDRLTVQCFDKRPLRYLRSKYPGLSLSLLVEDSISLQEHLELLGFVPTIYSCHYPLVDESVVDFCTEKNMLLIPWTVNEEKDIRALLKLGVDGIISDYPALCKEIKASLI